MKFKVLSWFIGITSILLFLFSFSLYYLLEESINLRIKINLYHSALMIEEDLLSKSINREIIENKNLYGGEVAIIKNDKIIIQTKSFSLDNIQKYINSNKIFFLNEIDEYTINGIYILKFDKPFNGCIVVYKKGLPNKAEDIEDILLVLNPILLLLLIIIGNKVIDKILVPIKNITQCTKRISINNFSHKINLPKDNDEIKELIKAFNKMIERLKNGVDILDEFNSNVSHELRTPLTVIQGELELALKKERSSNYYQQSIKKALTQTQEINSLVESLLLLTKYSKQNIQSTFIKSNLDSIFMDICEKYTNELKNKNIKLHINRLHSISIDANQFLITSIFSNLIDNAIKYSKNSTNIYISLFKDKNKIYFIIEDEGIGIAKEKLEKVTDRFYRVDDSRNKTIKGFGLGLSIVKNSVELHNGILEIKSHEGKGTTVEVIL